MDQSIPQAIPNKRDHVYVDLRWTSEDPGGPIEEKKIITEDLQDFFEPLVFKDNNTCDHIIDFNEELHGHYQIRDRITCTSLYPDSLFVCGTSKIFEYNRKQNTTRVIYDRSNSPDYSPITVIKSYKNYLFFGDRDGVVSRLILNTSQVDRVVPSAKEMVNGFGFYEFDGKDYVVLTLDVAYEAASLKLVHAIPIPDTNHKTCAGGIGVSPSSRFMIVVGDRQEIYVYEIVPEGDKCTYKIRRTFGVAGNCHTAHWVPDESCFAVSSEAGYVYLFSFKVVSDTDLETQLLASYQVKKSLFKEAYYGGLGIETVKFHPRSDVKLMAYSAANYSHVYVVDYSTLQIVQILVLPEEKGRINTGVEFSPDGKNLYAIFSNESWSESLRGQLLVAKSKSFDTLTELCLNYIRKHKNNWNKTELRNVLPELLFKEIDLK